MTKDDALSLALSSHGTSPKDFLWDIGQLDDDTVRELNRLSRQGTLTRSRRLWPFVNFGTHEKTVYYNHNLLEGGE